MNTTTTFDDVAVLDPEHVGDIRGALDTISRGEVGTETNLWSEGLVLLLECSRWLEKSAHGHRAEDGSRDRRRIGNGPPRAYAILNCSPDQGQPRR